VCTATNHARVMTDAVWAHLCELKRGALATGSCCKLDATTPTNTHTRPSCCCAWLAVWCGNLNSSKEIIRRGNAFLIAVDNGDMQMRLKYLAAAENAVRHA